MKFSTTIIALFAATTTLAAPVEVPDLPGVPDIPGLPDNIELPNIPGAPEIAIPELPSSPIDLDARDLDVRAMSTDCVAACMGGALSFQNFCNRIKNIRAKGACLAAAAGANSGPGQSVCRAACEFIAP